MLYSELIPAQKKDSRWLMVVLHGLGDSMEGYRWLPQELRLPAMNYLLVNAPDRYYGGYSWFDFPGDPVPGTVRSCKQLSELLDRQRAAGFPTEQSFMFGFSQGCMMNWEVGMRYPHRLAGVVGISGMVLDANLLLRERSPVAAEQKFFITHGWQDPLLQLIVSREQAKQMKQGGANVEWHEFTKPHTIIPEEVDMVREFVVKNMA